MYFWSCGNWPSPDVNATDKTKYLIAIVIHYLLYTSVHFCQVNRPNTTSFRFAHAIGQPWLRDTTSLRSAHALGQPWLRDTTSLRFAHALGRPWLEETPFLSGHIAAVFHQLKYWSQLPSNWGKDDIIHYQKNVELPMYHDCIRILSQYGFHDHDSLNRYKQV